MIGKLLITGLLTASTAFGVGHHPHPHPHPGHPPSSNAVHGTFVAGNLTGSSVTVKTSSGTDVQIHVSSSTILQVHVRGSESALVKAMDDHQIEISAVGKTTSDGFQASMIMASLAPQYHIAKTH